MPVAIIRAGLVGIGKVARDQHIPVLRANPHFELVACTSRNNRVDGVANFTTVEDMLAGCPGLDAVVVCSPPQVHYEAAKCALLAGKHVFMEKPPCATTAELERLAELARIRKRTFFQTWHLRCAPRVDDAERWLKGRKILGARVVWKEDVRHWHPGQSWIFQAGGFGVFDPGINAISVLTKILPEPVFVESAEHFVPENCQAPIAADLVLRTDSGARISTAFDFLYTGEAIWDIEVETDGGALKLSLAGAVLSINGRQLEFPPHKDGAYAEYAPLYRRFAELIAAGESEIDATPFRLVADAFLAGKRTPVARFEE
jgi:predicted dehydrogenase